MTEGPAAEMVLPGAHEQAGADGAADGDQLDVPVAELPLKMGRFPGKLWF